MSNDFSKGMVKYTSRDYQSILSDFLASVPLMTDLWKPEAESDPGYVLGKFLASVADMLGVNVDWLANEIFAPSVSQRKDAEKVFGLLGYKLGWYTAARTEVTITNQGVSKATLNLGFGGNNFSTLTAGVDITGQSRIITYNLLPNTYGLGNGQTRSTRSDVTDPVDVFTADTRILQPGESTTIQAIEGELRNYSISVQDIKLNGYLIKLPSQHVDPTAVWMKGSKENEVQWVQVSSPSQFVDPEPRFALTYDSYSNAQIQVSAYLDMLEDYSDNTITIYWIDCSGVIGSVGENVLSNLLVADPNDTLDESTASALRITNLSNTLELPHTMTVTGKSPETAKEAYENSRNFINTWDSLITLPDFTRFLRREPGVDCGVVLDCQKAVEINLSIYNDTNLTTDQKKKKYITNLDFAPGEDNINWAAALNLEFNPSDPNNFIFATNFKRYTAMCFAIHNHFEPSSWGEGKVGYASFQNTKLFNYYQPPTLFIDAVKRDYAPVKAMTTEIEFGKVRVFEFHIVGTIYPNRSLSRRAANDLIELVKEKLSLYFSTENRELGKKPTLIEIASVIKAADSTVNYFDPGIGSNDLISWDNCDIDYFNPISFSRYCPDNGGSSSGDIVVAQEYITD